MAPSRGKGKARASRDAAGTSSRATRSSGATGNAVPSVYKDLLSELDPSSTLDVGSDRPLKKRRVATGVSITKPDNVESGANGKPPALASQQTVEDSSQSKGDDDDDDDLAFEDVELEQTAKGSADEDQADIQDLSISVDTATTPNKRSQANRTKPISASEKAFRVMVHKMHILCLLGHCMYVNSRCNNEVVQRHLKSKVSKRTVSYLNPDRNESQFQRNRSFVDGLQQASEAFRGAFQVTASGMRRAKWSVEGEEPLKSSDSDSLDLADFIKCAKEMKGSQDVGNQLLCAMLRAVGVESRLVCSLQMLPFANVSAKTNTPRKYTKPTYYASPAANEATTSDSNTSDKAVGSSKSVGQVPSARRRIGQPNFTSNPAQSTCTPQKKKPIRKLSYPIFWTEAFNTAQQKWVPVDPLVTQTVNKYSKLEPPSIYEHNQLAYVIAFESSNTARDVTVRYAKAYNAKTRRQRIESTPDGTTWLRKALRIFRRGGPRLDREQIEDIELAQKEAKEGLPNNVQDFKDHPYYALERHLKRHEVLHPPERSVGKVNAGTAAKPRMEVVFRREDVKVCRSAEKWFRVGKVVREGEQPLKRVAGRRRAAGEKSVDADEGELEAGVALYAEFQTEPYIPEPVIDGKVPRNAYGNLDIYVPSMVPSGGVHIRHPLTQQAAKILKTDAVDAVTGFQFKGRQGTAVVEGAVVAEQYADAVRAVVVGLEDERVEEESTARSVMALRVWKRFLVGLRIKQRVSGYGDSKEVKDGMDELEAEDDRVAEAGGFFPDEGADSVAMPTAGRFSLNELSTPKRKTTPKGRKKRNENDNEEEAEGTTEDEAEEDPPAKRPRTRRRNVVEDDSNDEYMPDIQHPSQDGDNGGGGFLPGDAYENDEKSGGGISPDDSVSVNNGGGFLNDEEANIEPEDEDRMSDGGFLVDERPALHSNHSNGIADDGEGGSMLDDRGMDLSHGPPLSESTADDQPDTNMPGETMNKRNDVRKVDENYFNAATANHALGRATNEHSPGIQQTTPEAISNSILQNKVQQPEQTFEANEGDEDDSDKDSMMSHDPDDEDAEPDWLEYESP